MGGDDYKAKPIPPAPAHGYAIGKAAGRKEAAEENTRLRSLLDEAVGALEKSIETIKAWHNMGMGEAGEFAWDIYYRDAPEMKPIKQTITKLKEELEK
jgi:hypothetical protein